jgi:hypothetical protein
MRSIVKKMEIPPKGDGDWEESQWQYIRSEHLKHYMGNKPEHFPKTKVKVAYNESYIFVMFRVEDRYIKAVATEHQDAVCKDSCVEFFFTPNFDISKGYFNLEMNCGGTMLLHFHPPSGKPGIVLPKSECEQIKIAHSMPRIVNPEITQLETWTVEYWIPINLLKKYCDVNTPKPQTVWRANFYKCGDDTSHPHWLTWSPVEFPKPNFHLPQFFGELEFE